MTKEKVVKTEVEVSKMIDKVWRPATMTLIAVAIGYGSIIGYKAYELKKEKQAQEKLFAIQKAVEEKTEEFEKPDKKIEKNPESLVKNFEDQIKNYEEFIGDHEGNKAAFMAAVQLAGLSVTYKDLERAEKVLSGVVENARHDLFGGLVISQLGTVLMDLKKYPAAIEQFSNLLENKKQTYFHPQALLRLGTCYLENGDFEKAESSFKRLESDFPTTQAAGDAKNLIKLLALKKGDKA